MTVIDECVGDQLGEEKVDVGYEGDVLYTLQRMGTIGGCLCIVR
jgi:hypothetical protein